MMQESAVATTTKTREAFFIDFAHEVRERFPSIPLMVTGGFRSRAGMEAAVQSKDCDIVGIGRPAAVMPKLPKDLIFNKEVPDDKASIVLNKVKPQINVLSPKVIGAGAETVWPSELIQTDFIEILLGTDPAARKWLGAIVCLGVCRYLLIYVVLYFCRLAS
jgi:hypothetical protein